MLKLLKHLRTSTIALTAVVILLIIQAFSDLSLPTYTSDIINNGVIKGGIDTVIPKVIRISQLNKILLLINDEEKVFVMNHYTFLSENDYTEKEWSKLKKQYPTLEKDGLCLWNGEEEEALSSILALPMIVILQLDEEQLANQLKEHIASNIPPTLYLTEKNTVFDYLRALPNEIRAAYYNDLTKPLAQMSDMEKTQVSLFFVKSEYMAVGVNVERMQTNYILFVGAQMLGLALIASIASILVTLIASKVAAKMGKNLRSQVFQKVLSFSNREMDQFSTASLITRSTNDIQQIQMFMVMFIRILFYSPILAIGGILKVLNTNTDMAWILIVGVGTLAVVILALFLIVMPKFRLMQKLVDQINLVMREIITGIPVIRAFSTEEHEKKRFDMANMDLTKNNLFVNRAMTFMMPAIMLIMNLISILILWEGAQGINVGNMQVGDMVAFIQYTMQIIMSFLMLTMISVMLPRATVSAKRIDEVLTTEISIQDPISLQDPKIRENSQSSVNLQDQINVQNSVHIQDPVQDTPHSSTTKGFLEFKNVSFRYPNAEEDVLSEISFTAKPGETTAIIGSTGSGKSTLINLIPRFYDVTKGSIILDGTDLRDMKQHTLRDKLGFIPQKGSLFSGTIESNIKFGNPNASEKEVADAARIAQAKEFIDMKEEKYQSPISEGGTNVSGGQKQRLSIARAIAKKPNLYIFDDSFSALDYKTDSILRKTLKEELSDSTIIIVAQRISTIMNAEQILVLDDGKIVGKGTHKELLKNCDVYYQIASSQLSKEELSYE